MTWETWTTLGVLALMLGTLVLTRIGPDLVFVGALTLLLTFGILTVEQALGGFANEAVITIGALFVVVAGLRETHVVSLVVTRILGRPTSLPGAYFRLLAPVAAVSAFMNNTPLVAMTVPVVKDWSKRIGVSASKLLMPLSFATILGGLCTLIGTSTNLVVNGLLIGQTNHPGLGMFDVAWIGVPCAVAGLAYLTTVGPWLLPSRGSAIGVGADAREYVVEMIVPPGSGLAGKTIEQADLRHLPGLFLIEIARGDQIIPAVGPTERLEANDRLIFAGVVESVVDLQRTRGLRPATDQVYKLNSPRSHRCLVEAVVSDSCPLLGESIRAGRFRTRYNAAVIAVARNGQRLRQKIGDVVLEAGDILLVEAHASFVEQHRNSRDFLLVSQVEDSAPPRHDKAWLALAVLAGMVVVAAADLLSVINAALLAACAMIALRCCGGPAARRSIDWQVLTVIGAGLGIGKAVERSGVAATLAPAVIGLAQQSPWLSLALVYLVTMLVTELLSNAAAAALMFPIALATAHDLGVSFMPFVMALMIAASCGFATPIGYQTNLMVYGPGGYRFTDFVKLGGPLNVLVGFVAVLVAPLVWPFTPQR